MEFTKKNHVQHELFTVGEIIDILEVKQIAILVASNSGNIGTRIFIADNVFMIKDHWNPASKLNINLYDRAKREWIIPTKSISEKKGDQKNE